MTTATSSVPSASTRVERPSSVRQAAELLRDSRGSLLFRGGGTKMSWGGRPAAPDFVVETGGLDRLIIHNPADMTVAVEAGMPLRKLQDLLASAGQWLALDPPTEVAGATIGGLLASGDSGPRRLRYGAMRDLVIGITLVLPDGTVARAGGHVIKNVAGYDLSKLVYGSLGTLGLLAEVVLRVHPRPAASTTVVAQAPVATAARVSVQLLAAPLEPSAVEWIGDPRDGSREGRLAMRFEGSAAGVAAQIAAVRELVSGAGLSAEELTGPEEAALWQDSADARAAGPGQSVAFAGTLPSNLPMVADAVAEAATAAGVEVMLASHSALGLHTARLTGTPAGQAGVLERWRDAVIAMGGSVMLRERPAEVEAAVDPVGPAPSAVALMRAVKASLDPDGRCAPGRFGSWY